MIAGLAACGQTTMPAVDTVAKAPAQVLGFAIVTFDNVNTANPTVTVRTTSIESGLAGITSQTLSRPARISIMQTSQRGAAQDPATTHRWMFGKLSITNNSSTTYQNVTLSAVNIPGYTKAGTSLIDAKRIDGFEATPTQYNELVPTNPRRYDDNGIFSIPNVLADYQMYSELYNQNITDFMATRYGGTSFPYGFVSRATGSTSSRSIAPGNGTGQVSVAFATPDTTATDEPQDIKTFTYIGLITADAVTTSSADVYEPNMDRACAQVTAFGGNEVHGFVGQPGGDGCLVELEPSLRISTSMTIVY